MSTDTLAWWAENLPQPNAQVLLVRAAKEHTAKFTDPHSIGVGWSQTLRQRGYNALCPYARNWLAHEYLRRKNALQEAPRKILVH